MSTPPSLPVNAVPDPYYLFADFELIPSPFSLRRGRRRVILQPQPARLLVVLVRRRGEIVSREEIRHELWPDGGFLDHEQAINFAIRKIRIALDDSARSPRFVETVPRLGYRFVAPVEEKLVSATARVEAEKPAPPGASSTDALHTVETPDTTDGRRSTPPPWAWAIASAVLFALAALGFGLLASAPSSRAAHRSPVDSAAALATEHDAVDRTYLQGRFLVEQEGDEQIHLGIAKLRETVARRPDFAPAHAALALGFLGLSRHGRHFSSFMPEVEEKALRALELDENLAEAYWLRSIVLFAYRHDWQGAEASIRRAIDLHDEPSPEALRQLAMILAATGRTAEAVQHMEVAVALDPAMLLTRSDLALALMYDRRFNEALAASEASLEIAPHDQKNLFLDATLRHHLGDESGALKTLEAYFATWGEPPPESVDAAWEWLIELGELRRREGRRAHLPMALLYALEGRRQEALDHLVEACDHDPHWELPMVGVDPRFDAVRELPSYAKLGSCLPLSAQRSG